MNVLYRKALAKIPSEAVLEAYRAGRLDALLRGEVQPEPESSTTGDLRREDLVGMSPEEIAEAYRAGRLDAFLRGERQPEPPKVDPTTGDTTGNLYREDLVGMSPEEIVEAKRAGRLDAILRGERRPEPESESEQSATGDPGRLDQWPPPGTPLPERR